MSSFETGARISLFLGDIKGQSVWVPGNVISFNEIKRTYDIECDEFGKALECPKDAIRSIEIQDEVPQKDLSKWEACKGTISI
mmetsp:Transcript_16471/g.19482  ORF Transcript_16471/g.19482 Transcript_16471/m.19482 type:complete len:83 (+) Transcript_16471:146-394(+)